MNIVFMGTPDFAARCLEALLDSEHTVNAVFTQPDKPVGRKRIMTPPAVKVLAQRHNIPVYQPTTLREGVGYEILKEYNPDICVVVAYGKLLPSDILNMPKYGCINIHGSLLPKYRGAAPIQWAVANGEKVTGVTSMLLDEGMDTGAILLKKEREILRKLSSTMNKIDELNQAIQRLSDKLDDAKYVTIKFNEEAKKFDWDKDHHH